MVNRLLRMQLALLSVLLLLVVSPIAVLAQTETVLHDFTGAPDGAQPVGGLVSDKAGNLYGATSGGGDSRGICATFGCGTLFRLSPNSSGGYTEAVLYAFTGGKDGSSPSNGLAIDADGNLFGVAGYPGRRGGIVFELSPNQTGDWDEKVLYSFNVADGSIPSSAPTIDSIGNIYGTTAYGGNRGNCGVAYRLSQTQAGKWVETVLHAFSCGRDGSYPSGPLTLDSAGNVYGVTMFGGSSVGYCYKPKGCGVAFRLTPNSSGGWVESVLYNFNNSGAGAEPSGGVTFDGSGNLYGTTNLGGIAGMCEYGCGSVFQLSPTNQGVWTQTVLYQFPNGVAGDEGALANGSLAFDASGNLYGTSAAGGDYNRGQVFELSPDSNGNWVPKILYSFSGGNDGSGPAGEVIFDASANILGATGYGGTGCDGYCGITFQLTP